MLECWLSQHWLCEKSYLRNQAFLRENEAKCMVRRDQWLEILSILVSLVDLERKEQELEQLRMDCEHFRARLESVQADSVREKKVRCSPGHGKRPRHVCGRSLALTPQDTILKCIYSEWVGKQLIIWIWQPFNMEAVYLVPFDSHLLLISVLKDQSMSLKFII